MRQPARWAYLLFPLASLGQIVLCPTVLACPPYLSSFCLHQLRHLSHRTAARIPSEMSHIVVR